MHNLIYSRTSSTDNEIFFALRLAIKNQLVQIHESILSSQEPDSWQLRYGALMLWDLICTDRVSDKPASNRQASGESLRLRRQSQSIRNHWLPLLNLPSLSDNSKKAIYSILCFLTRAYPLNALAHDDNLYECPLALSSISTLVGDRHFSPNGYVFSKGMYHRALHDQARRSGWFITPVQRRAISPMEIELLFPALNFVKLDSESRMMNNGLPSAAKILFAAIGLLSLALYAGRMHFGSIFIKLACQFRMYINDVESLLSSDVTEDQRNQFYDDVLNQCLKDSRAFNKVPFMVCLFVLAHVLSYIPQDPIRKFFATVVQGFKIVENDVSAEEAYQAWYDKTALARIQKPEKLEVLTPETKILSQSVKNLKKERSLARTHAIDDLLEHKQKDRTPSTQRLFDNRFGLTLTRAKRHIPGSQFLIRHQTQAPENQRIQPIGVKYSY